MTEFESGVIQLTRRVERDSLEENKEENGDNICVCDECEEEFEEDEAIESFVYDRPSGEESHLNFCSENCQEEYLSHPEFPYLECFHCHRLVCYRNPSNGYHGQFHKHPFEEDQSGTFNEVCETCHASLVLSKGQKLADFVNKRGEALPKISGGVWFDEEAFSGYLCDPDFDRFRVSCGNDAIEFNSRAADHINAGKKVVVSLDSMAIGGIEGRVSLFHTNAEEEESESTSKRPRDEGDEGDKEGEVEGEDGEEEGEQKEECAKKRAKK